MHNAKITTYPASSYPHQQIPYKISHSKIDNRQSVVRNNQQSFNNQSNQLSTEISQIDDIIKELKKIHINLMHVMNKVQHLKWNNMNMPISSSNNNDTKDPSVNVRDNIVHSYNHNDVPIAVNVNQIHNFNAHAPPSTHRHTNQQSPQYHSADAHITSHQASEIQYNGNQKYSYNAQYQKRLVGINHQSHKQNNNAVLVKPTVNSYENRTYYNRPEFVSTVRNPSYQHHEHQNGYISEYSSRHNDWQEEYESLSSSEYNSRDDPHYYGPDDSEDNKYAYGK